MASVGGPAGLTHQELIAEEKGPSWSQSLGDIPVLLQTGAGRGEDREVSLQQHSGLATSPGEAVSGCRLAQCGGPGHGHP